MLLDESKTIINGTQESGPQLGDGNHLSIRILEHDDVAGNPLPSIHIHDRRLIQGIGPTNSSAHVRSPPKRKNSLDAHLLHPASAEDTVEIGLLAQHHRVGSGLGADGDGDLTEVDEAGVAVGSHRGLQATEMRVISGILVRMM
jgi:hypothetical protein